MDAFISHSSANRTAASELEKALEAAGLAVWPDDSEITLGALLGQELQDSIRASHVLLLLRPENAAASRWVTTGWLTAFHLNREHLDNRLSAPSASCRCAVSTYRAMA